MRRGKAPSYLTVSVVAVLLAFGASSSASASAFSFELGAGEVQGSLTLTPLTPFPVFQAVPPGQNAYITNISLTYMSPAIAALWATTGGIGFIYEPGVDGLFQGSAPLFNYFTLSDTGDVESGLFDEWPACFIDCNRFEVQGHNHRILAPTL